MKKIFSANTFARCIARRLSRGIITLSILTAQSMILCAATQTVDFQLVDGTVKSMPSSNLEMTFTSTSLIANDGVNSLEIPLNQLVKFYFSDSLTGIETLHEDEPRYTATDINGIDYGYYQSLEEMKQNVPAGVYVVTNGIDKFKIIVK